MTEPIEPGAVEPVVDPITAGDPVTPPEPITAEPTPGDPPSPEPIAGDPPAQDAVDKRIGKITAEKYGFKREADSLRTELDQLKASQGQPNLPAGAPQLEDFDYDDGKHQEAVIEYKVKKALEVQNQATAVAQTEQAKRKISDDYNTKEAKYIEEHPKYVQAVAGLPKFPKDTLDIIYEMGPQVTHYLADNPDKAYEIAALNLTQAAVKLGQISVGLTAVNNKTVIPSTAPEPTTTISGQGAVLSSSEVSPLIASATFE